MRLPSSRASSLPQEIYVALKIKCGSELARDEASSPTIPFRVGKLR
ncbi:hypothetical protein PHLH3_10550 [Pseudomonas sp. St386]|nr:hypothetical protein PFLU4_28250 [Pseudomonas fluorescens]RDH96834.1 hypothetical protein DFO59_114155 [Pseudomonas fluorescens]BBP51429.1 hypothetical protein PHLH3_10550 [Pseudomonas sp. St386]CAH0273365.1 hypothetical protein SRABI06_03733 [Pseudomonas brassicacearum]SDP99560.1 hypothetical protein SAMN04490180_5681 [Pseudomonas brassicacearum]